MNEHLQSIRDGVQAVRCIVKYGLETRGSKPGNLWG